MTRLTVFETAPAAGSLPAGAIVDVPHPDDASRARFGRRGPFDPIALVWTESGVAPDGAASFVLEEHVGWLAPDAAEADPVDVVKQVSFLARSDTVDLDGFRARYRHHVEVARRHMHTLWQYVQYDVVGVDGPRAADAAGIVAVSALWFRTTDDFRHRYFASADDEAAFRAEEGFLDLSRAFSFVVTSHPSAGPAARPGREAA